MKILLLEDNQRLAKLIKNVFEKEGYKVNWYTDGEEALESIANGYHCFILDINVPSLDGLSILETIRLYHENVPVIIISSNHELEKVQKSYELGCDDFLKKPFYICELIHKVKKCLGKSQDCIELWTNYCFDIKNRRLYDGDKNEVKLAKKELLFLELFVKDRNKMVNYKDFEEYVWEGKETNIENIRALIKRLRKKLPKGAIKSIKELGYTLGKIENEKIL